MREGLPPEWKGVLYGVMPWVVHDDPSLNDGDRATLMQIARFVQVYKDAYPTQQTLARLSRVNVPTVVRRVRKLVKRGLLEADPGPDGRIHYSLLPLSSVYTADEIAATAHMPKLDALRETHRGTRRPWSDEAMARSAARKSARRASRKPITSDAVTLNSDSELSPSTPITDSGLHPSGVNGPAITNDALSPSPAMAKGNKTENRRGNRKGNVLREERADAALTAEGASCSRGSRTSFPAREQNSLPITGDGKEMEVYITCDPRHTGGWREVVMTLVSGLKIDIDDEGLVAIGNDDQPTPRTHADAERMARTISRAGRERGLAMTALTCVFTRPGQEDVGCRLLPRQGVCKQSAGGVTLESAAGRKDAIGHG